MMNVNGNWNGDAAYREVVDAGWSNLVRAVVFYWTALQNSLNVSNPRPYHTPAPPGDPPHKRTGFLAANVVYELEKEYLLARVGVLRNALYGMFLELGTRFMAPRPWLLATLEKVKTQMQAIIKG